MFCPNCGKEIDDDAMHCVHCGGKVAEEPAYQQPQQPVYVVQQQPVYVMPQQPAQEKPKENIFAIIALVASCLGILTLGLTCILGIVFGFLGLNEAKKTGKGKGMSKAGLIVGFIGVGLIVLSVVLPVVIYLLYLLVVFIIYIVMIIIASGATEAMMFIPML